MPSGLPQPDEQYPAWVGLIYIFNLIVGTGALTIPAAFSHAGWLLGLIVIILLALVSFLTSTFVIEAMAAANAILQCQKINQKLPVPITSPSASSDSGLSQVSNSEQSVPSDVDDEGEHSYLLDSGDINVSIAMTPNDFYSIQKRVEMGQMASMFFNKFGVTAFYIIICIYLFGDLAIYGAAIAKSLRDVTCNYIPPSGLCNQTLSENDACWASFGLRRCDAYRIYVASSILVLGPFAFFNVQKTKLLQIGTSLLRWCAMMTMVVLATIHLAQGKGQGTPPLAKFAGLPNLFGVCVYSFMCHHSLPSLVTPIKKKSHVLTLFALDYFLVLVFYLLLALTGIFTFATVQDLYTLNFQPNKCDPASDPEGNFPAIQYFLALFPVFTISANYPIIAITLKNNLKSLCFQRTNSTSVQHPLVDRILLPLLAIIPPGVISVATANVQLLVGVTGAFAGAGVQYVIPAMLALCSRWKSQAVLGSGVKNRHSSPFRHSGWIAFTLLWTVVCLSIIIVNYSINGI